MYGAVVDWFSLGLLNGVTCGELNITGKEPHVYIRSLTADNTVQGRVCRAQTQVYVKARLWGRLQKYSIVFMVSKSTSPLRFLQGCVWKSWDSSWSWLPCQSEQSRRRALERRVQLQSSCVEIGETSRGAAVIAALHWCWLSGRVARREPLLSKTHMKAAETVTMTWPRF